MNWKFWWNPYQIWCSMAKVRSHRWVSLLPSLLVPIWDQRSHLRWYFSKKHPDLLFENFTHLTYVVDAFGIVLFLLLFASSQTFLPLLKIASDEKVSWKVKTYKVWLISKDRIDCGELDSQLSFVIHTQNKLLWFLGRKNENTVKSDANKSVMVALMW